ncbi:MAG: indole-3-glycerol phosphate synthase TrpC [Deltaproteobacteria bacterium]|uniref:Indole-3-glycerol phosphate synthase n=1 Tax=Candidatus Desulfacyla euxinica TaxID=2841693 RepID=A0A8J6N112_9DELT|nr:indole-3-glycerol phosphate synthase TrpC [Candidatus Desulfacyla euxinica]MBL7216293.1 indole-3-glycerol phosphate synthase TrpC [Desulfobacteraceae bacterium]
MHFRLMEILAEKQREVARLKKSGLPVKGDNGLSRTSFAEAISVPDRIGLIAEIKFASPSAGIIRKKTDPVSIGRVYEGAGAAAVSLITDKCFFGGELDPLPRLKRAISLPILRKDFIIDVIQIKESFLFGADAILLIARILSHGQLKDLLAAAHAFGLDSLTEIHDRDDLDKAVECGAKIIGINNRDLDTFEVDIKTTIDLAPLVPEGCILVSESGIMAGEHIRSLWSHGVQAVLVGSTLMKSKDVGAKVEELVGAGKKGNGKS